MVLIQHYKHTPTHAHIHSHTHTHIHKEHLTMHTNQQPTPGVLSQIIENISLV